MQYRCHYHNFGDLEREAKEAEATLCVKGSNTTGLQHSINWGGDWLMSPGALIAEDTWSLPSPRKMISPHDESLMNSALHLPYLRLQEAGSL